MEVIELLSLNTTNQFLSVQMLPGSNSHSQNSIRSHFINQLLWNMCARLLTFLCHGINFLVDEGAESGLERTVGGIVVRGFEGWREPGGFTIGGLWEGAGCWDEDFRGLVRNSTDAERRVLLEDFLSTSRISPSSLYRILPPRPYSIESGHTCVSCRKPPWHLVRLPDAAQTLHLDAHPRTRSDHKPSSQ